MKQVAIILLSFFIIPSISFSQKVPMSHDVYDEWNRLQHHTISNDGEKVSFEINKLKGDGWLHLRIPGANFADSVQRGYKAQFNGGSDFMVFMIKPHEDTVLQAKRGKKKKKDMPKDSLGIWIFDNDSILKFPKVKSYKLAEENADWLAILFEKQKTKKAKKDTIENKDSVNNKKALKKKEKGERLLILNPVTKEKYSFENVKYYSESKKSNIFGFIKNYGDSIDSTAIYIFDPGKKRAKKVFDKQGFSDKISIDEKGEKFAFIYSADTIKEKSYSLYYLGRLDGQAEKIADTLTHALPHKWTVSKHGKIYFSEDSKRLFFATAHKPIHEPKDTLLDEEKAKLDVWSWTDKRLQPRQLKQLKKDKKKSYTALYDIENKKVIQLSDTIIERVKILRDGISDYALGFHTTNYKDLLSWEYPSYRDVYAINLNTGKKELILEKKQYRIHMSPNGNYVIWFESKDSSWYSIDVESKKVVALTKNLDVPFYNVESDVPAEPYSYGIGGWVEEDSYVLIYDQFDIWKADPSGKENTLCLTNSYGRKNQVEFRYIKLDDDADFIGAKENMLLSYFDENTKNEGYFRKYVHKSGDPGKVLVGQYHYYHPIKAKNADKIIRRKSSCSQYPDVWYDDMSFTDPKRLSYTNPQQSKYLWPSVELYEWIDFNGDTVEGLLYKPENFDKNKKYPLLIYFYEKYSDNINAYRSPSPSRSIINPAFYGSNGYVIFVPDISYKTGYPGESAYNSVVSGALSLAEKPWINRAKMGLQGQSWGGYQVAYLVTQTNIFACGMAGAPVSNMTSAYGGIRWGSGLSRAFQYEETQSRIGGSLWEKMRLYIANSPLFFADKVKTPLLMMHNDNDGAVPWYQGIEFFNALRRLRKPVWMLVYNDEKHNLTRWPNRVDLSIRMKQFFDHYLMDEPPAKWMVEGIPAIKKGKEKGYELIQQ